jgi:hypothetical protein
MSSNFFGNDLLINSGQEDNSNLESEVQAKGEVKLIVFVNANDYSANETLLEKIVSAVGLSAKDYGLLKVKDGDRIRLVQALHSLQCSNVLVFGDPSDYLGNNVQWLPYEILTWSDRRVLCSHTLTEVASSDQYKKFLWTGLKSLMNVG